MPRNPLKAVTQWDVKAADSHNIPSRSASPRRHDSRSRGRSGSSSGGRGQPRGDKGKGKGKRNFVQVCFAHHPRKGRTCKNEHCNRLHLDTTDPHEEQRYFDAIASWEAYKEVMDKRVRSQSARCRMSTRGRSVPASRQHPFTARRRRERSGTPKASAGRSRSRRSASSRKAAEQPRRTSPSYSPQPKRKGGRKEDRSRSRRRSKSRKPARAAPRGAAGGKAGGQPGQPPSDGQILSFRGFVRTQRQSMEPEEAVSAYGAYKEAQRREAAERFFGEHHDSGLLGDLYSPQSLLRTYDWRRVRLHRTAAAFHKELEAGRFAELSLRLAAPGGADEPDQDGNGLAETSLALTPGSPPHFLLDPEACSMTMKGVEPALSVWDFHEVLHALPGFLDVWMEHAGEKSELRTCRASFDSEAHLDEAVAAIAGASVKTYAMQPTKAPQRQERRVLLAPVAASRPQQLQADVELAGALITKLDALAGLPEEGTQQLLRAKAGQAEAQLDLQIHYLRSVHHFCFYSAEHASDVRELAKECGAACLRRCCGEAPAAEEGEGADWAAAHGGRLRRALARISEVARPTLCMPCLEEEPLRSRWADYCVKNMKQEAEGRHRCLVCSKLFKGPEYVAKHLLKAHGQGVQGLVAEIMKERTREAFMSAGEGPGWD